MAGKEKNGEGAAAGRDTGKGGNRGDNRLRGMGQGSTGGKGGKGGDQVKQGPGDNACAGVTGGQGIAKAPKVAYTSTFARSERDEDEGNISEPHSQPCALQSLASWSDVLKPLQEPEVVQEPIARSPSGSDDDLGWGEAI